MSKCNCVTQDISKAHDQKVHIAFFQEMVTRYRHCVQSIGDLPVPLCVDDSVAPLWCVRPHATLLCIICATVFDPCCRVLSMLRHMVKAAALGAIDLLQGLLFDASRAQY